MALSCPNKSLPEWKRLVDEVGEREALNDYFQFGTIRSPYAVKDKLERLNIANYTNKNFKIGERYFKPTVESLIDVEKNSSVVDAMVTHFGYRGLQSEEDLIKRKFTDDIRPVETVLTQPTTTTTKSQTETVDNQDVQPQITESVSELFDSNPELANIGTQQLYSQYLEQIFPNSKVKDIVYHGTDTKFEGFLEDNLNYFGTQAIAKGYGKNLYPVVIEINKPYYEDGGNLSNQSYEDLYNKLDESGSDGFISNGKNLFIPKTEEQIHMLGGKQDIEGFKEFVSNKSAQVENIEAQAVNWNYKKAGKNLAIGDVVEVVYSKSTKPEYPYFLNFMVDGVPNINNEEKSLKLALKGLTPEEKISFCNHFGITMTEENGTKC